MKQTKLFKIMAVSVMMIVASPLLAETKPIELELKLLQMQESSYDKAIGKYHFTINFLLGVLAVATAIFFCIQIY